MRKKIMGLLMIISIAVILLTGCGDGILPIYNVTITGHIEDSTTGQFVDGADIYINSTYKDTTDKYGNFGFEYSTIGSSTLKIEKAGYTTKTIQISPTSDGEISLSDITLSRVSNEYSGSISGQVIVMGGVTTTSTSNVKVMATKKEVTSDGTIYWIYSDIAIADLETTADENYIIENAKIDIPLTVIGFQDYNGNDIIESGEFFGEYGSTITLTNGEHRDKIDFIVQPEAETSSIQSADSKKIIIKTLPKGE